MALTATNHAEDQPVHLRLPPGPKARSEHVRVNVEEYAGLLGRACPAQVYEYVPDEGKDGTEEGGGWNGTKFVINSQVRDCVNPHSWWVGDGILTGFASELHTLQTV